MNSWISLSIALFVWIGFAEPARAEHSVAVLGVRSQDGEDELERRIAHALRTVTDALPEHAVSDRVVSLDQMILAHGCDEPNDACLALVAETLAVELLLFGSVVAKDGAHDLELHAFDARSGHATHAGARGLTPAQLSPSGLTEILPPLLHQLFDPPATGKLRIEANRPRLLVSIDGAARGTLDEEGVLEVDLPPGRHQVRVTEPVPDPGLYGGQATRPAQLEERQVEIAKGTTATLALTLADPGARPSTPAPSPRSRKRSLRRIFGWVSVGLGAAFAAATVYSWARIKSINDDGDYLAYRRKYPRGEPGSQDVCKSAERGVLALREPASAGLERTARDLCREADKLEVLQYVFLGGTLLGAGAGTYLLLTAPREGAGRARLAPRFDGSRALLEASFRF